MYQLAPNVDILFSEAGDDPGARVRAAAAAGFDAVELWTTLDKDIDALADVLAETGVTLTAIVAEPRTDFAWPSTDLAPYYEGLDQGIANAKRLGCERIVLGSGLGFPGMKRAQNLERLVEVFRETVELFGYAGVKLLLEPVNIRVDHPGALTDRTADAVAVARAVDSRTSESSTTSTTRSWSARTRRPNCATPAIWWGTCSWPMPPVAASPAAGRSTGHASSQACGRPATAGRSGSSTSRPNDRSSRSSTFAQSR